MHLNRKLQIFSGLLWFFVVVSGFGQKQTINFVWNDDQRIESTGALVLNWNQDKDLGYWGLQMEVTWYDSRGESILDIKSMPYIYLSDYDIEIESDYNVDCLNFSISENIKEIQFQDRGELRFVLPAEIQAPGLVKIIFRYFLSQEDVSKANIDPIRIPAGQEAVIPFPDTRIREDIVIDDDAIISLDSSKVNMSDEHKAKCVFIRDQILSLMEKRELSNRQLGRDDVNIGYIRNVIDNIAPGDTSKQDQYEQELQRYLEGASNEIAGIDSSLQLIKNVRNYLDSNVMPSDSSEIYSREILLLETEISTLREEYTSNRIQIRTLLTNIGSSYADVQLEGMKNQLEDKYGRLFRAHIDTAASIQSKYSEIEPGLKSEIAKGPRKAKGNDAFTFLRESHTSLQEFLDSTYIGHRESYFDYRDRIEETGQIPSIETLHIRFDDIHGSLKDKMNNMDIQISSLEASMNEPIIRPTPYGLVIGGSLLIFIIIFIITMTLSRRKSKKAGRSLLPGSISTDNNGFSLIDSQIEESVEYYRMKIPNTQQDIMLSEVHLHIRVIKSVYHLIQGALLDKKPENFGGLMFGRQYKVSGNGNEKNILIVERVVAAKKIRPDMNAGQEDGALLVNEIESLVAENKKQALLGWFCSAPHSEIEMPENAVKVHRTYFREKWQIAFLIYPGSDSMNSGLFVRRKSGFFDTIPSKEFLINWDNLYQFAVDPPDKKVMEDKKKPNPAEYLKIELNRNWSDSIVEHLYIHPDILSEISNEKKNRIQMVAGQIANGFLYGEVWDLIDDNDEDEVKVSFEVFINKFTLATSSENPRELPGAELVGWIRFDDNEIFETLKTAIPYHEEIFKSPYQISILLNTNSSEIRFFSRKHSLEMNNNTIETEEYNLDSLLHLSKNLK